LASIVLACLVTVVSTAVLIAAPARFALTSPTVRQRVSAVPEHVVYVAGQTVPPAVMAAHEVSAPRAILSSSDTLSTKSENASVSIQASASPTPAAVTPSADPRATAGAATAAPVGAPATGLTVGFSSRRPGQIHYDSALGAVQDKLAATIEAARGGRPAPSQAERDEQMRAEARDAVAARGAGTPNAPGAMAAGGIAVPLPFGGPSNAQRERDRRAYEDTKRMMARVQRRADSVVAARRRRFADSLAQVADSQLRRARPR
jgi:hypothetical protein